MSLGSQAAAGLRWSVSSHAIKHVIQLGTMIILVRLLGPADFGLMAMAMVFVGVAYLFQGLGTGEAIIQRRELSHALVSSVFWVNAAAGVVAAAALTLLAPLVGLLYSEPRIVGLLGTLSLSFIAAGLGVVHRALLRRELAFKTLAKVEIGAALAGGVTGITAAVSGAGVWSLVAQTLTSTSVTTLLLWMTYRWRPAFTFAWAQVKAVTGFSLNLTGFNIFNHFTRNADYMIIGGVLGSTELGYYTLAYQIMLYPLRNISAIVGRVMYPVYARLQHDDARLRAAFLKISATIAIVTFPMMVGLMLVSDDLVTAVFGERWAPAAPLIVILAPVGLAQSLITTFGAIYQAKGRTGLFFMWSVGLGALAIAGFLIGVRWGVAGVAMAYLIVTIVQLYPCLRIPFGLIGLSIRRFLAALWRPLACSLLMGVAVLGVMAVAPPRLPMPTGLALAVGSGVVAYAVATWMLNRELVREAMARALPRPRTG